MNHKYEYKDLVKSEWSPRFEKFMVKQVSEY